MPKLTPMSALTIDEDDFEIVDAACRARVAELEQNGGGGGGGGQGSSIVIKTWEDED